MLLTVQADLVAGLTWRANFVKRTWPYQRGHPSAAVSCLYKQPLPSLSSAANRR